MLVNYNAGGCVTVISILAHMFSVSRYFYKSVDKQNYSKRLGSATKFCLHKVKPCPAKIFTKVVTCFPHCCGIIVRNLYCFFMKQYIFCTVLSMRSLKQDEGVKQLVVAAHAPQAIIFNLFKGNGVFIMRHGFKSRSCRS